MKAATWAAVCLFALVALMVASTPALALDDEALSSQPTETAATAAAVDAPAADEAAAAKADASTSGSTDGQTVISEPSTEVEPVTATDPSADTADESTTTTDPVADKSVAAVTDSYAVTDPAVAADPAATATTETATATTETATATTEPTPTTKEAVPATSAAETASVSAQTGTSPAGRAMHRLYNPNSGEHFYTASADERDATVRAGWKYEGIGWVAPLEGTPVYRMYNPNAGDHHYTASVDERNALIKLGWTYEGVGWYSGGSHAVLRQYNPNAQTGTHNYTLSQNENDTLKRYGWRAEGIGWYAIAVNEVPNGGFWTINKAVGTNALVWVAANGYMAKSRMITPEEGAGRYAYATPTGAVVRGTYAVNDTTVYIADTTSGALFSTGWVVGNYGNGNRRYYINADHTCRIGQFSEGDNDYVGLPSVGYVGTGDFTYNKVTYHADGNGVLLRTVKATYAVVAGQDETKPMTTASLPAGGKSYVFLPSSSTEEALRSVTLWAINDNANVDILIARYGATSGFTRLDRATAYDLLSMATKSGNLYLLSYKVSESSSIQTLAFMFSSDIPTLFVTSVNPSENRAWIEADASHERSASVTILLVQPDGTVSYTSANDGNATIKGRGNSTWTAVSGGKKPYQIKLNKKFDLLGTGDANNAAKKWILLANVNDTSLVKNTIAYNLGLELGMVGTECAPVDVFYDGEYRGNYLLCEKVEIGSGRINITDLEKAIEKAVDKAGGSAALAGLTAIGKDTNAYGYEFTYLEGLDELFEELGITVDITGGYLVEADCAYYRRETYWFDSPWAQMVIKEPEYVSKSMMKYISEYFYQAIKNVQSGKTSASTTNRDVPLFDLDSLAKSVLVNEFLKNPDLFASSTYFYKDVDSKDSLLYSMPMWDFDSSMGTRFDYHNKALTTYHSFCMPTSASRMTYCPVVLGRAQQIWTNTLSSLVKNVILGDENAVGAGGKLRSMTYYLNQIKTSASMDVITWGLTVFGNEFTPYPTYAENVTYQRNWLTWRTAYFDDNILLWTSDRCDYYIAVWDDYDYGLVFDAAYYLKCCPDVAAKMEFGPNDYWGALQHFVKYGINDLAYAGKTARNFNVKVYKEKNSDLRAAFGDNLVLYYKHYCEYGFLENRVCV